MPEAKRPEIEAADQIMRDYFGKRWEEDSHLVDVWAAIHGAIHSAIVEERIRGKEKTEVKT